MQRFKKTNTAVLLSEIIRLLEASDREIAELEHQIKLSGTITNPALWSVYADHLTDVGDPMGELISLELKMAEITSKNYKHEEVENLQNKINKIRSQIRELTPQNLHSHGSFRSRSLLSPESHINVHFNYPNHIVFSVNDVRPEDIEKALNHTAGKFVSTIMFKEDSSLQNYASPYIVDTLKSPIMQRVYFLVYSKYRAYSSQQANLQEFCRGVAESEHLKNIRRIVLNQCALTPDNFKMLIQAELPNLQTLLLSYNNLDDSCLESLSSQRPFPKLKGINISTNTRITIDGLSNFLDSDYGRSLHVVISYEHATEEMMQHFPNLRKDFLHMKTVKIT